MNYWNYYDILQDVSDNDVNCLPEGLELEIAY